MVDLSVDQRPLKFCHAHVSSTCKDRDDSCDKTCTDRAHFLDRVYDSECDYLSLVPNCFADLFPAYLSHLSVVRDIALRPFLF